RAAAEPLEHAHGHQELEIRRDAGQERADREQHGADQEQAPAPEDFDLPWLGVAADVSYFRPATDVQTVPLSLLVMARYGFLKDDEFKAGRLQPYVGLGGALFFSNLS